MNEHKISKRTFTYISVYIKGHTRKNATPTIYIRDKANLLKFSANVPYGA